jgi:hypothetical protein
LQGAFAIGTALTFGLFHGDAPMIRRCHILAPRSPASRSVTSGFTTDPIAYTFVGENYTFPLRPQLNWASPTTLQFQPGVDQPGVGAASDRIRCALRLHTAKSLVVRSFVR